MKTYGRYELQALEPSAQHGDGTPIVKHVRDRSNNLGILARKTLKIGFGKNRIYDTKSGIGLDISVFRALSADTGYTVDDLVDDGDIPAEFVN